MTQEENIILNMFKKNYWPVGSPCLEGGYLVSNFPNTNVSVDPLNKALDSLIEARYIEKDGDTTFCLTESGMIKVGVKPKPAENDDAGADSDET